MAILEVIEWADAAPDVLVKRVPETGSGEFRLGSQLVVREFQTAVFFQNGQALDGFGPGRYTLETENIPLLTAVLSLPFGGESPFRSEVYFVSLKHFVDLKWGTPQPLALRDPELALVRLRSFGTFALEVADPGLVVNKLVGGHGLYATTDIVGYLRGIIASQFAEVLAEARMSLFDLPAHYGELGAAVGERLRSPFAGLGLNLLNLCVTSISTTEETQRAIDQRAAMGAIGDMTKYLQFKAAQGMGDAGGSAVVGAAVTMGLGAALGASMAQSTTASMSPRTGPVDQLNAAHADPASLSDVFAGLRRLVDGQLALAAAERAAVTAALGDLEAELAAPKPNLTRIKAARSAIVDRWTWMAEPLSAALAEAPARAALAAAADDFVARAESGG